VIRIRGSQLDQRERERERERDGENSRAFIPADVPRAVIARREISTFRVFARNRVRDEAAPITRTFCRLGCSHDEPEISGCPSQDTDESYFIMSPIVFLFTIRWSPCSRKFITAFLE